MLRLKGMAESVLGFAYGDVGVLTTRKFTREIPANIPHAGVGNHA